MLAGTVATESASLWLLAGGVGVGLVELSVDTSWRASEDENCNPFDLRTGEREGEYVPVDVTEGSVRNFHFLFCFDFSLSPVVAAFWCLFCEEDTAEVMSDTER